MDPVPKNQVSSTYLRLAAGGNGVWVAWGWIPPNTLLQLTLDMGGVGGPTRSCPLVSIVCSSPSDLGPWPPGPLHLTSH